MTKPPLCCEKCKAFNIKGLMKDIGQSTEDSEPFVCLNKDCPCHQPTEPSIHEALEKVDKQIGGALRALGGDVPSNDGWEKEFDEIWEKHNGFTGWEEDLLMEKDIKSFIRTHTIPKSELRRVAEGMKKSVCGCDDDSDPQALGYHTKNCDLQPYGYNQALSDLLTALLGDKP